MLDFIKKKWADAAFVRAARKGAVDSMQRSIDRIDRNVKDTALRASAENGHTKAVEFLLQSGAQVNCGQGNSPIGGPLHLAAIRGHYSTVEVLIEHGANVDETNHRGETPLFAAAGYPHVKVIECLVRAGANVKTTNRKGETTVDQALVLGVPAVAVFLRNNGCPVNCTSPFTYIAVRARDDWPEIRDWVRLTQMLLAAGFDVNDGQIEDTPLDIAVQRTARIAEVLHSHGGTSKYV